MEIHRSDRRDYNIERSETLSQQEKSRLISIAVRKTPTVLSRDHRPKK